MLLRLLRKYLAPYRNALIAVVALQTVQTFAALSLPTLTARVIDNGVMAQPEPDIAYIWRVGGLMLLVSVVQVVFNIAAVYFGARAAMGFGRDVRGSVFDSVTAYSAEEVTKLGAPSLITRITNDVTQVQTLVVMAFTLLVGAPITMIGGVFMAIREDGALSLMLLVSVPVLIVCVGSVVIRLVPQFAAMQEYIDRVNLVLREQITGLRVVRAFVREPHERDRFAVANEELTDVSLRAGHLMAMMFPTVTAVLSISNVAAVWFGANRIGSGAMGIGSLVAFLTYLVQILMSVMMATFVVVMIPRAAVCADRIQEALDTEPAVKAPESPVAMGTGPTELVFDTVGFAYPGAELPVLTDITFSVEAGQTLAIIGSTGSGKTTLLNLIPRLFDATAGRVAVNGNDVRDLDPEDLWASIGLVPQKPYLFSGTVAENLRFAKPDATDQEIWAALATAQAADFVSAMPQQLDTFVAQGGTSVSGGQRQRLAIARALIKRPQVFLFDDSFSALDLTTDAKLRAALTPVVADAVTVIVGQRVSTIANADQILVLEAGQQVGLGTHAELVETCGTYREIVESQRAQAVA
ncbi:MAG: ABC transporter ATP-binding protein [Microthrixaceae bacterium]|nr:ABC transporter ATP-binding protein [Microthrixaceae bacterium]